MDFANLDTQTRELMISEINSDIAAIRIYQSPRLTAKGLQDFPSLLLEAAKDGDTHSLASAISFDDRLNTREISHRNGNPYEKDVPVNASQTLAEGEFNRFYMRGVCLRALSLGLGHVTVYRAKQVNNPRPASIALDGTNKDAQGLLDDLRKHVGTDTALGLPNGPNSGLSIRLPKKG